MSARCHCASARSCDRPFVTQHFLVFLCHEQNSEVVPNLLPSRLDVIKLNPIVLNPANYLIKFYVTHIPSVGRDSSVGIATRYGLNSPGIESRWEARFSVPVQTGPGAHPASCTMGTGSFPGVKQPGRGVDYLPQSIVEVKERVELYPYSPSGHS